MVANISNPTFSGGINISIKVPLHQYDATIAFYRDTLNLPLVEEEPEGCIFQFGPSRLWVDKAPQLAQADVSLELETNDTLAAARYLKNHGMNWRSCRKISTAFLSPIPPGSSISLWANRITSP